MSTLNLKPVEIKAMLPARDFDLCKRFYEAMGFTLAFSDDEIAYFHLDHCSFLLQNLNIEALAQHFEMHLLVEDADDWHARLTEIDLAGTVGGQLGALVDQPWAMREFIVTDPSGVRWRVAHNTPKGGAA